MNKGEFIDDMTFEQVANSVDAEFRIKIEKSILNAKLLTHKCQFKCYSDNSKLGTAENCARNCFKPMIFIKKNVTRLMENTKEKLEKCKVNNKINSQNYASLYNMEQKKCFVEYTKNLDDLKDEVEFIYEGYCKNFDKLMPEEKIPKKL